MSDWTIVAPAAEIEPGGYRSVDIDGTAVAVFNGRLAGGTVEGDQVVCPRHGARFCIRTGAALSAPAYEPTACLPVRVEQGEVQVRDDRWD